MGCEKALGQDQTWGKAGRGKWGAVEHISPRGGVGKLGAHSRLQVRLGFHWLVSDTENRGSWGLLGVAAFPSSSSKLRALRPVLVMWPRLYMCASLCVSVGVFVGTCLWACTRVARFTRVHART